MTAKETCVCGARIAIELSRSSEMLERLLKGLARGARPMPRDAGAHRQQDGGNVMAEPSNLTERLEARAIDLPDDNGYHHETRLLLRQAKAALERAEHALREIAETAYAQRDQCAALDAIAALAGDSTDEEGTP